MQLLEEHKDTSTINKHWDWASKTRRIKHVDNTWIFSLNSGWHQTNMYTWRKDMGMMVVWPTFPAHRAGIIINLSSTSNCYQQMRCVKFKNKETTTQTRPYIYIYIHPKRTWQHQVSRAYESVLHTQKEENSGRWPLPSASIAQRARCENPVFHPQLSRLDPDRNSTFGSRNLTTNNLQHQKAA